MKPRQTVVALLCLALVGASPAFAQRAGTRLGRDATEKDAAEALDIVAECSFERRPAFTKTLLSTLPGTADEVNSFKPEIADLGMICMDNDKLVMDGKDLVFKPGVMRWRLALVSLRHQLLKQAPTTSPQPRDSSPWFMAAFSALPAHAKVDRGALTIQDFGHCVAVSEWDGTRKFLAASKDSPEERAAVAQLVPVLGSCLPEKLTLKLTPDTLRSALAEPVYHLLDPSAVPVLTAAK